MLLVYEDSNLVFLIVLLFLPIAAIAAIARYSYCCSLFPPLLVIPAVARSYLRYYNKFLENLAARLG